MPILEEINYKTRGGYKSGIITIYFPFTRKQITPFALGETFGVSKISFSFHPYDAKVLKAQEKSVGKKEENYRLLSRKLKFESENKSEKVFCRRKCVILC